MLAAVLFDLYDTLAYVEIGDYRLAKAQMAAEAGVPADAFIAQWKMYTVPAARGEVLTVEERVARVLRDLSVSLDPALIGRLARIEVDLQEQRVRLFPGTLDVLKCLGGQGLSLALVTNTSLATFRVPEILGIHAFLDTIVFSYALGVRKPDPGIYLVACKRLGVQPSACLFVGDGNDRELEGARDVGMQTVMVGRGRHELLRTKQSTSWDHRIQSLGDLLPIVGSLVK